MVTTCGCQNYDCEKSVSTGTCSDGLVHVACMYISDTFLLPAGGQLEQRFLHTMSAERRSSHSSVYL